MEMSDAAKQHMIANVQMMVKTLASQAHELDWPSQEIIRAIDHRVSERGAEAITLVEAIWICTLVTERSQLQVRKAISVAMGRF